MDPRYSLTGLLVGFLVGVSGMGGGSLMTPLLILLIGVPPTVAVGSDLAYSAVTKLVGGWLHRKAGSTDVGLALRLALGSVPASLLGVWCIRQMELRDAKAVQHFTAHLLGVMLVVVAVVLLFRSAARSFGLLGKWRPRVAAAKRREGYLWPATMGAILGFLVGLTSVGSGTLFGVGMIVVFGLRPRLMVGTDVYQGAILTFAAALGHIWAGHVDYGLVANLLVGSIPGVMLGSISATRLPERIIRPTLACVMLISGFYMLRPATARASDLPPKHSISAPTQGGVGPH